MASRRLVPPSVRDRVLGVPSDIWSLERHYVLPDEDLELVATRRRDDNRLGLAVHIALLRHPGQGWLDGIEPPPELVAWLAEQAGVSGKALDHYAGREPTRSGGARSAISGSMRSFQPSTDGRRSCWRPSRCQQARLQQGPAERVDTYRDRWQRRATGRDERAQGQAAFDTDDGPLILERLTSGLKAQRLVLPSTDTLERIGVGRSLQAAIELLRDLNRSGRRKLPDVVPMPLAGQQWRSAITSSDRSARRRIYETAVAATLRDRLRAGDVWVDGSRDYRRFDAYLPSAATAETVLANSGVQTDPDVWLAERRETLHERLDDVEAKLAQGRLDGVRLENGRLRITPCDAVTPAAAARLDRVIDALAPRIRITELLWEVNARTRFLDAFNDVRSGRTHSNPAAILATILAGATNLGLERMANASTGVSHAQLSWANAWYLRPETYADALARIIDAHHALPFARIWGEAGRTSSDGRFFPSRRNVGEINAKYGPDPGLKIYSFLSGTYGSFHANVIGATAGEAPFVLDGLVGNAAAFDPLVHHVDTGGVSDHVFALFHLLGLSFVPRLRDFPDRRLARFDRPGSWRALSPIMGRPVNEVAVVECWSDVPRLAAGIKTLSLKPSDMLRKLGAYRQQNRLHLALGEIGRIERSLFMLDWIEDPQLHRRP